MRELLRAECAECGCTFTRTDNLLRHVRNIHGRAEATTPNSAVEMPGGGTESEEEEFRDDPRGEEGLSETEGSLEEDNSGLSLGGAAILLAAAILATLYLRSRLTMVPAPTDTVGPAYPYGTSWGPFRPGG